MGNGKGSLQRKLSEGSDSRQALEVVSNNE